MSISTSQYEYGHENFMILYLSTQEKILASIYRMPFINRTLTLFRMKSFIFSLQAASHAKIFIFDVKFVLLSLKVEKYFIYWKYLEIIYPPARNSVNFGLLAEVAFCESRFVLSLYLSLRVKTGNIEYTSILNIPMLISTGCPYILQHTHFLLKCDTHLRENGQWEEFESNLI
jgi:hypothetical protein